MSFPTRVSATSSPKAAPRRISEPSDCVKGKARLLKTLGEPFDMVQLLSKVLSFRLGPGAPSSSIDNCFTGKTRTFLDGLLVLIDDDDFRKGILSLKFLRSATSKMSTSDDDVRSVNHRSVIRSFFFISHPCLGHPSGPCRRRDPALDLDPRAGPCRHLGPFLALPLIQVGPFREESPGVGIFLQEPGLP